MNKLPTELSASDFWEVVFRNKVKLIVLPLVIMTLAVGVTLYFPRTYRSEARLFLQVGHESVGIDPTATTGQTISLMQSGRDEEVKSAIEVLGSRGVLSQVVEELGPDYVLRGGPKSDQTPNPITATIKQGISSVIGVLKRIDPVGDHEQAVIEIEEGLKIEAVRSSTVLVVTYDTKSAEGAKGVLDALVDVYQREHLRIHRNANSGDFFADQQGQLKTRLDEAQNALMDAKNRMGIASVEGRRSTLENQIQSIELDSFQTEQSLATSLARMKDLEEQLDEMPERLVASVTSKPNEGADLMRDQLYERQIKLLDLKSRYTDSNPLVQAVSAQVEEAKKVVDAQSVDRKESTDDANPLHRELTLDFKKEQSQVAGLESRLETLTEQRKIILADLEQLNRNEVVLDRLAREEHLARDKFMQYANNLEQARMDKALEDQKVSGVSVAQAATLAQKPVKPSKPLCLLGGFMLAGAVAVGSVVASEKLNTRIRGDVEAEETLELPVLATIPDSPIHGRTLNY
ncbi:Tyrosine-protein kinase etk [Pirellulimonas nuda]|uniref:Tyrosine-protein kinase etk n=1 Tax=Pirellulimonas nuda TaxID=2528009 RepID=A0A518DEU5_9BACT|nr:Wzz/FepE/Etk N-terminal domain-containing protein [Pirellulimonas nuda]QDU90001.1 Tyrosine-protein kinase etk [Pirellulimonas nuda]